MRDNMLVKTQGFASGSRQDLFFLNFCVTETSAHWTFWDYLPSPRVNLGVFPGWARKSSVHTIIVIPRRHFRTADQNRIRGVFQYSEELETLQNA